MKLLYVTVLVCICLPLCNSLFLTQFLTQLLVPRVLRLIQLQQEFFINQLGEGFGYTESDDNHHEHEHNDEEHDIPIHSPILHSAKLNKLHYEDTDHQKHKIHKLIKHYKNNVCHQIDDYDTIEHNEHCWYNPDGDLTVPQIIQRNKYPLEIHSVTTEDGYYLQLFRIPYGRYNNNRNITNKRPVFLQHGIFASSAPWVIVGNKSLAFILAEKGYDVWLGNSRGTTYSKGHANYSTSNPKYWDWSWTEMGMFDLPSSLDVVTEVNGRNDIIYIGQSLGTNLPYVYGSLQPQQARDRISLIINLAPTLFLGDIKTKYKYLAHFTDKIEYLAHKRGTYEFLPQTPQLKSFWEKTCLHSSHKFHLCVNLLFDVFGTDWEQFSPETLTLIISHFPAGTSVKNAIHLGQSINSNNFCPYDYGKYKNILHYTHTYPPSFNLTRITIPSFIMYGENDYTGTEYGAKLLYHKLPNTTRVGLYKIKDHSFNHVDFVFAKDVVHLVYDKMLNIMEQN